MLRSSKAAMDDELKQVSQKPRRETETTGSQSSTSGSNNPSTTITSFHSSATTTATNKAHHGTLKGPKKFSQQESNQPRKPEPPTRNLSSASVAAISATPHTHVVMAQGSFPQGHVHLTSADLLVHPQPSTHHDSSVVAGSGCIKSCAVGGGATSSSLHKTTLNINATASGIVEAPEEWVLHTSCQGESNELLRECCLQSESRSDDSYPVHHSPSRTGTTDNYHLSQRQGHLLQAEGPGVGTLVQTGNPHSSSIIFNIMSDPPTLSSPINPSHIAKAICPPPPSDSELGSLSHHPWSSESHHSPPQVCSFI